MKAGENLTLIYIKNDKMMHERLFSDYLVDKRPMVASILGQDLHRSRPRMLELVARRLPPHYRAPISWLFVTVESPVEPVGKQGRAAATRRTGKEY